MTVSFPQYWTKSDRLASFSKKTKKYPGWPHGADHSVTPESLADAGFYFTHTTAAPDGVQCFACPTCLSNWCEGDDALDEHIEHASNFTEANDNQCWYAEFKRIERERDGSGDFTWEPKSEELNNCRLASFGEKGARWMHENKRTWGITAAKLANAGFFFTGTKEYPDSVSCPYCKYEVEGWEKGDDPMVIHQTKRPGCHFFTYSVVNQSILSTTTTATNVSTSSKAATTTTKSKKKGGRPKKAKAAKLDNDADVSEARMSAINEDAAAAASVDENEDEDNNNNKSESKSKSKSRNKENNFEQDDYNDQDEEDLEVAHKLTSPEPPLPKTRSTRSAMNKLAASENGTTGLKRSTASKKLNNITANQESTTVPANNTKKRTRRQKGQEQEDTAEVKATTKITEENSKTTTTETLDPDPGPDPETSKPVLGDSDVNRLDEISMVSQSNTDVSPAKDAKEKKNKKKEKTATPIVSPPPPPVPQVPTMDTDNNLVALSSPSPQQNDALSSHGNKTENENDNGNYNDNDIGQEQEQEQEHAPASPPTRHPLFRPPLAIPQDSILLKEIDKNKFNLTEQELDTPLIEWITKLKEEKLAEAREKCQRDLEYFDTMSDEARQHVQQIAQGLYHSLSH